MDYQATNHKGDPNKLLQEEESDIDLNEQSELIEKFFANENQALSPDIPHEIEEVDSEYSTNSNRKANEKQSTDAKTPNIPLLKTKVIESKSSLIIDKGIEKMRSFENKDLAKEEQGLVRSVFSDRNKTNPYARSNENSTTKTKNSVDNTNMLIRDKNSKVANDNPYSDNRIRTSYLWKNQREAFQAVKGSQNLYNNSIKKKNYFYPHVGVGGGAGGMRTFKWRDTTPMKFTLTTLSHTTNHSSHEGNVEGRVIQPVGSS